MNDFNFFSNLMEKFTDVSENLIGEKGKILYEICFPFFSIGVTAYLGIYIFQVLYQKKDDLFGEFFKHFLVLLAIALFIGLGGAYFDALVPFVLNFGDYCAQELLGSKGTEVSAMGMVDEFVGLIMKMRRLMIDNAPKSGITTPFAGVETWLYASALLVAAMILAFFAFIYILVAKIMTVILLSIGVIFFMFAAFPATRSMFTAWISTCFNYIFLIICYSILFSLIINLSYDLTVKNEASAGVITRSGYTPPNYENIILLIIVFVVAFSLLSQITTFVSSLTGGVGINSLVGSVGNSIRQAIGAPKAIGGAAYKGYKGGKAVSSFFKKFGNNKVSGG